jgi:cytochrome c5
VTVDLRGKSGTIVKSITVDSTAGMKSLLVQVAIPPPQLIVAANTNNMDRTRNMELAKADRQSVFKSDCAECHVKPAIGKLGKELYAGACAICHEAEHRATMVPDLHIFKHAETRDYWTQIIADGKLNSLMPAFAFKGGGILNDQQIGSLVDYMMTDYAKDTNLTQHASMLPVSSPAVPVSTAKPQASVGNGPSPGLGPFPVK